MIGTTINMPTPNDWNDNILIVDTGPVAYTFHADALTLSGLYRQLILTEPQDSGDATFEVNGNTFTVPYDIWQTMYSIVAQWFTLCTDSPAGRAILY